MSASQAPAITAIAFQLAAAVDAYEADLDRLVTHGADPEHHHRVSGHMDRMRMYAVSLPVVSVAWVEVLIRHFEITQALWRLQKGDATLDDVRALRGSQREATARLRQQCMHLLADPGT
jgi:hypothetical protein